MSRPMTLEVLVAAKPMRTLTGCAMHLLEPVSFWGGVSAVDGSLTDARCAHHGESVSGRVLLIRELKGSTSTSSVLLELIYRNMAPSAIVVAEPDAILALGVLVAHEMQWPAPAIFRLPLELQATIAASTFLSIDPGGVVSFQIS